MTPTNKLRFVQRRGERIWDQPPYKIYEPVQVLQQWWDAQGEDIVAAGGEWRDVPTEVES